MRFNDNRAYRSGLLFIGPPCIAWPQFRSLYGTCRYYSDGRKKGTILCTAVRTSAQIVNNPVADAQLARVGPRHYKECRTQRYVWCSSSAQVITSQPAYLSCTVPWRIKFKLCCIMHSVFYGRCPAYLTATVQSLNASRPHLHGSTSEVNVVD